MRDLRAILTRAGDYPLRLAPPTYLVFHHSAVDDDCSAEDIALYHVNHNLWPGCGYAFVVHWSGVIDWCNDLDRASYNVASRNQVCLGICIPGNWSLRSPPEPALASAAQLVAWLRSGYASGAEVKAHYEVALPAYATSCCGSTWPQWKPRIVG